MDLHGIGPSGAARLLVEVGDITRFPDKQPLRVLDRHRTDRRLLRRQRPPPPVPRRQPQINRVLHIMATVQLRNPTEGRAYYDRTKARGKTSNESMRLPQTPTVRHRLPAPWSTTPPAHTVTGPGGQRGDDSDSSAAGSQPHTGTSDKPLPGPATTKPTTPLPAAS